MLSADVIPAVLFLPIVLLTPSPPLSSARVALSFPISVSRYGPRPCWDRPTDGRTEAQSLLDLPWCGQWATRNWWRGQPYIVKHSHHPSHPTSLISVQVRIIQVLILYWPHQVSRKNLQQSFSWGAPSSTGTVISTKTGCKWAVKMIFQGFKPRGHFLLGSDKNHSEIERAFVRLCDNMPLSLKKREN